ncbi:hypothetical protein HNQ93_002482 [Hymenobacter luteus]|uniref:Uncharacterized protein n=2 Tax=Hymenobacter TaxID=89966 RepID=A0A7W9T105_9BACT|nr:MULTISPECIES: hypothetical protein [Hymenobacter]MBB4601949.1 hypothetical protein [Hymenobacter latericoloratus]MBB6059622.1 hypothetical protein [Hymenobacter luteus]
MPTRKKASQTLVLDADQVEGVEQVDAPDHADDVVASLCPSCGELLAWHEVACSPAAASTSPSATAEQNVEDAPVLTRSGFAFALGQPVQPAPEAPASPVVWRGQVKARHPRTGLVHRVNVYRLDNGYWDCYYEAELSVA